MPRSVTIVGVLLLALTLWLGWQLREARRDISDRDRDITGLNTSLDRARSQLAAVDLMARANDSFQLAYQQEQDAITTAAVARAEQIKRLTNENPDVKKWADTPLPADVIRLQQRPAVTGAAGYRAFLSEGDALPAASERADH